MAITLLGPDLETLESTLRDMGARHAAFFVRPSHWPKVGRALLYALQFCLEDRFTEELKDSWTLLYNFLGYHMVQGLLAKNPNLTDPTSEAKYADQLQCTGLVSASDITYSMVSVVCDSWEQGIKKIPNWSEATGDALLRSILRQGNSEMLSIFGLADSTAPTAEVKLDRASLSKGIQLMKAFDMAVGFLGPDLDPLESQLRRLGRRHAVMGTRPSHWPLMGQALFEVLEEFMGSLGGPSFDEETKEAWTTVYTFWGYHMIQGVLERNPHVEDE